MRRKRSLDASQRMTPPIERASERVERTQAAEIDDGAFETMELLAVLEVHPVHVDRDRDPDRVDAERGDVGERGSAGTPGDARPRIAHAAEAADHERDARGECEVQAGAGRRDREAEVAVDPAGARVERE